MQSTEQKIERAALAGLAAASMDERERSTDISLAELAALVETAGGQPVVTLLQNKPTPDPRTFLGEGKVAELKELITANDCDLAVFDNELSPSQMRVLEEELGVHVLDRSGLILDIFAQRAQTREGQLQVELAQYQYLLPRLTGMWTHLVRQTASGGSSPIGTRGPGETRLEMDRRRIRRRMSDLRREIDELSGQRSLRRARREKNKVPVVALVGYTNAGKSTLLNTLSGADVLAEDKLFATLDPVVRTVKTPAGDEFLLVDTVGFISKLPHALVDAFHSTLEEALLADVLLIVSDGASGEMIRQHDVVLEVLSSLGAADKPMIDVINKADLPGVTANEWPGAIAISAKKGEGLDALLEAIRLKLRGAARPMHAVIPYAQGGLLAKIHADGQVLGEEYTAEGIDVTALADEQLFGRLAAQLGEQAVTWQD